MNAFEVRSIQGCLGCPCSVPRLAECHGCWSSGRSALGQWGVCCVLCLGLLMKTYSCSHPVTAGWADGRLIRALLGKTHMSQEDTFFSQHIDIPEWWRCLPFPDNYRLCIKHSATDSNTIPMTNATGISNRIRSPNISFLPAFFWASYFYLSFQYSFFLI